MEGEQRSQEEGIAATAIQSRVRGRTARSKRQHLEQSHRKLQAEMVEVQFQEETKHSKTGDDNKDVAAMDPKWCQRMENERREVAQKKAQQETQDAQAKAQHLFDQTEQLKHTTQPLVEANLGPPSAFVVRIPTGFSGVRFGGVLWPTTTQVSTGCYYIIPTN